MVHVSYMSISNQAGDIGWFEPMLLFLGALWLAWQPINTRQD